jgi:hypothetical protein
VYVRNRPMLRRLTIKRTKSQLDSIYNSFADVVVDPADWSILF